MTTASVTALVNCDGTATFSVTEQDLAADTTVTGYELWGTVTGKAGSLSNDNGQFTLKLEQGTYTFGGTVRLSKRGTESGHAGWESSAGPVALTVNGQCEVTTTTVEQTTTTVPPTTTVPVTTTINVPPPPNTSTTVTIPGVVIGPPLTIVSVPPPVNGQPELPNTGAGMVLGMLVCGVGLVAMGRALVKASRRL